MSCLGKLFCSIINNRIIQFLEEKNIITPTQTAFRKDNRTTDHMFTLTTLINKHVKQQYKKNDSNMLFVCFVDLSKAFDTVWRDALFYKLIQYGIEGKVYDIIKNMYDKSKMCVKLSMNITEEFLSNIGVKQGCVLSPTLFNIFMNDLPKIFTSHDCHPANLQSSAINCLMYADDILLISKSPSGLQSCLNKLNEYCQKWKLQTNPQKSKIIIFNKPGHLKKNFCFKINDEKIEIVSNHLYLGIIFNASGSFNNAVNHLHEKANKAIFKLLKSFGPVRPPAKTFNRLFDSMIKPILTYGSEIWGTKICNIKKTLEIKENTTARYYKTAPEKCQIKWSKSVLGVHSKSTNIAVTAELGRYPILFDIYSQIIMYWNRLHSNNLNPILKDSLECNMKMITNDEECWLTGVKDILHITGMGEVWARYM